MFLQTKPYRKGLSGYGASELLADLRGQLKPMIDAYGAALTNAVNQFFGTYKPQLDAAIQDLNAQRAAIRQSKASLDAANSLLQSGQFSQTDALKQDINNMMAGFADEMKQFIKDEVAKAKANQSSSTSKQFTFGGK